MGNWLCACTKAKDSDSDCSLEQEKSLTQDKSSTKEKKNKRKKKEKPVSCSRKNKAERKNSGRSAPKEKLSITTVESLTNTGSRRECLNEGIPSPVDLTVVGHALPIRQKPVTPEIKHGDSNATVICCAAVRDERALLGGNFSQGALEEAYYRQRIQPLVIISSWSRSISE